MKCREYIKETLADHKYTQLAEGENCELWHCGRPGSNVYAFDIVVTPMGISVVGDIDGLSFRVGANYGINFLAGRDVSYYIHSKLESHCKDTEFDKSHFLGCVSGEVSEFVATRIPESYLEAHDTETPEWLGDHSASDDKSQELLSFIKNILDHPTSREDWFPEIANCAVLLEDALDTDYEQQAYELLNDFDTFEFDVSDLDFSKPSEALIERLYMVNEAAKQIMEIKQQKD